MDRNKEILEFYGKLKRMSYSQFEERLKQFGYESYKLGIEEGEGVGTLWTDEEIFDLLCSEGIGVEKARRIVERLVEE